MKIDLDEIKCITETAMTIRGSRRRITVPYEAVDILKLKDGDRLRWIIYNDGTVHIHKVSK